MASSDEEREGHNALARGHTTRLVDQTHEDGSHWRKLICCTVVGNIMICCGYFYAAFKVDEYHEVLQAENKPNDCEEPWYLWYLSVGIMNTVYTAAITAVFLIYIEMITNEHVVRARHYKEQDRETEAEAEMQKGARNFETYSNAVWALGVCTTVIVACILLAFGIWGIVMYFSPHCKKEKQYWLYLGLINCCCSSCSQQVLVGGQFLSPSQRPHDYESLAQS